MDDPNTSSLEEVLGSAWRRERRRALRKWAFATAARVLTALGALWALSFLLFVVFGMSLPWTFFALIGVLMSAGAFSQKEGREHLRAPRRESPGAGPIS
jgi:hypothetical protein